MTARLLLPRFPPLPALPLDTPPTPQHAPHPLCGAVPAAPPRYPNTHAHISPVPSPPPSPRPSSLDASINDKGLYDYLLINDDLEEAALRLKAIAARAAAGLDPEPGMVPERVVLEDVSNRPVPPLPLPQPQCTTSGTRRTSACRTA